MPRKFKIVKGGTHESMTCSCTVVVEKGRYYDLTCECTESKYFAGNVPQTWKCPECVSNRHVIRGQRQ
jgi:Zn finger protein HypA/HybF involved in hydrogenase expression